MNRRLIKQLLYGAFYLGVWSLFLGLIYLLFIRSGPGCFNNRKDGNEAGVDCGGACAKICLPAGTREVYADEMAIFYPQQETASVLVKVVNPNLGLAVRNFDYTLTLYGVGDAPQKSIRGSSFIYESEVKYLTAIVATGARFTRGELHIQNPAWVESKSFVKPALLVQERRVETDEKELRVVGRLNNQDVTGFDEVRIVAILKNQTGKKIGFSETTLEDLAPGESSAFTVIHPPLQGLDAQKTELFVTARRP